MMDSVFLIFKLDEHIEVHIRRDDFLKDCEYITLMGDRVCIADGPVKVNTSWSDDRKSTILPK
jgi:hypothetical protein